MILRQHKKLRKFLLLMIFSVGALLLASKFLTSITHIVSLIALIAIVCFLLFRSLKKSFFKGTSKNKSPFGDDDSFDIDF